MKVEEKIEKNIEKTLRKLGRAVTSLDCLEAYSDLQRFCTHYELQKKSEKKLQAIGPNPNWRTSINSILNKHFL